MASTTTVIMTDDLDGKKADETVAFALDGAQYEIDLSKKNALTLRRAVAEFIAAGRPIRVPAAPPRPRRPRSAPQHRGTTPRDDVAAIRTWAKQAGLAVSDRGRISTDIRQQYQTAQTPAP